MIAYRRDIDGLRAVAVSTVVLAHAGMPGLAGGYIGVDVFFVISGFLITSIVNGELTEGRFSLLNFYERRARRILPALFIVLAASLVIGWFVFPPPQYASLGASAIAAILFVSNIWFQRNTGDYFSSDAEYEPLLHTWSLGVEEQFYLAFPLALMAIYRWRRAALIPLMVIATVVSFAIAAATVTDHPVANFYMSPLRAWELLVGALLALSGTSGPARRFVREAVALAGLLAIAVPSVTYDDGTHFPGLAALPPVLGAAAIIWAGAGGASMVGRLLSTRLMVGIGLISYSLYLWHWPVLVAARNLEGTVHLSWQAAVAAIGISILAAWASWGWIERPFRQLKPRPVVPARTLAFQAGLVAICLTGVAAWVASADGVWQRIPGMEQRYLRASQRSDLEKQCWRALDAGQPRCILGGGAKRESREKAPSVFLWGDSHAASFIPALSPHLTGRELVGAATVKPGCAPVAGIDRLDTRGPGSCSAHNRRVLEYILAERDIATVLLVARWPLWATGERMEGEAGGRVRLSRDGRELIRRDEKERAFAQGLEQVVAALTRAGIRVVIFSAVPEAGYNPPARMLQNALSSTPIPPGPSIATVRAREASSRRVLYDLAERYDATLIDVAGAMCSDQCPTFVGGMPLYRDEDHLSELGAQRLLPSLLDHARLGRSKVER